MKTYLRILQYARPYADFLPFYFLYTILGIIFSIGNFALIIPLLKVLFDKTGKVQMNAPDHLPSFAPSLDYVTSTFNYFFAHVIATQGKMGALLFVCLVLVVSVFFSNVFRYLSLRLVARVRARVIRNMRRALYHRVIQLQLGYFATGRKGDLMSRFTNDVQEVEGSVVNTLTAVIRDPLTIVAFFAVLFYMSFKLTLFTLVLLPISGGIIASLAKRLRSQAKTSQSTLGSMLSVIDETLGGIRVIKAFNAQEYIKDKFEQQNDLYAKTSRRIDNTRDLASPFSEFAGVLVVAGLIYFGGTLILGGNSDLEGESFITYIVLFSQVLTPAKALSSAFGNIQRGLVAGERVLSIIDTEPVIRDKPDAQLLPAFEKEIELRNLQFTYGDQPVLQDINLIIPKGKTVALVGPSGGGKSTLADLLPRFYDPTGGQILIDGHDVRDCTIHSVRDQMGIVTQESILFNDTIFNNIRFNQTQATEEEVMNAARIANAHEFIMSTPEGYQTIIGDRGTRLSGGQRQRLSIARAVLRNPPILILDEATSALDTESEKLVQEALIRLMQNRTSLVIAHRLSTVQHADEIVVLQHGRIVERGTHDELLQRGGLYQRLSQMQTNVALA